MKVGILVKLSHLERCEPDAILEVVDRWRGARETYKIAGAVCAPTANTLPVVHIVIEAHWIDLIGVG